MRMLEADTMRRLAVRDVSTYMFMWQDCRLINIVHVHASRPQAPRGAVVGIVHFGCRYTAP